MARKKTDIKNIAYDDVKKLYYVTLYYGTDANDKPIKKTVTCKSKSDAKKILINFESDKLKENVVIPKNDTLEVWLNYWIENIVKPNRELTTYYGYKAILSHVNPTIGKINIQKLTPKDIQSYLTDKMKDGLSSNTVKKHFTLLKTSLSVAQKQSIINKNPIDHVIPPKQIKPKIDFYSLDQLKELFDLCHNTLLEPAIYLAGMLALRREEISGLKWDNVDFSNNIIIIDEVTVRANNDVITKEPKNSSSKRRLLMPKELRDVLMRVYDIQKENNRVLGKTAVNKYVVSNWNGEQINPAHLSSMFLKFIDKNSLPPISLRGLRHTVASIANDAGVTLYDISKMLGHATPDVTGRVYVEIFSQTNEKAVSIVANAITNGKKDREVE